VITTFHLPTKIIFGPGSLAQLGIEAGKMGQKAILVTGSSSMRKTGVLDRVVKDLRANGITATIFDRVEPNPHITTVDEGSKLVRQQGVDIVIGLGGGSVMDAAKGIALASSGIRSIWHYIEKGANTEGQVPPLILVPTVAASGSEANNGAVITNWETHEKMVLNSPHLYPKVSIVDPELTLTLPQKPTAQGGVDIFCHLAECYLTARRTSTLNDAITEALMRTVVESLPQVLARPDDIEGRTRLFWASTMACSQFTSLGGGEGAMTLHGIEHPLSGYYNIAHGDGLAALLPAWMRFTFPVRQDRFHSLGGNVLGAEDGIAATEKWLEKVGMRLRLSDLGIEPQRYAEMAASAIRTAPWLKYHPRPLDINAIKQIYQDS